MNFLDKTRLTFAKAFVPKAYLPSTRSSGGKSERGVDRVYPTTNINAASVTQQVRKLMKDSPVAKGVVSRFKSTVIGTGLRLDANPIASILGITEEAAREWADEVNPKFHLFCHSKSSTLSETENFYQTQALLLQTRNIDGEYFVRFHYSNKKGRLNPLQIQVIDSTQIQGKALYSSAGVFVQDDGIIRDKGGREIGYKIAVQDQSKPYKTKTIEVSAKGSKSGLTHMIHGFTPEHVGQGRGYSKMFGAIQDFQDMTNFQLAHVNNATNQALLIASIKPSKDAPASNPFKDILDAGTTPVTPDQEAVADNYEFGFNYNPIREASINEPNGMIVANLGPGETLDPFKNTAQLEAYGPFMDALTKFLSASLDMPIEVLKMQFEQNYSASRATLILYQRVVEIQREEEATDILNPVYEAWLSGEIASGRIQALGWSDPIKKAAWLNCNWIGSSMPNIDPVKTALANKHNIELNATNPDIIALELNGSDAELNKIKNDKHFEGSELRTWQAGFAPEVEEAVESE